MLLLPYLTLYLLTYQRLATVNYFGLVSLSTSASLGVSPPLLTPFVS